jgi:DNA-binding CsgD family transcriptional regulator
VSLTGATFSLGEGFLGQAGTTRQFGYWENIYRDPRTMFFSQNNMHPQSLFSYPIVKDFAVSGILFGGSTAAASIAEESLDLGHAISKLLSSQQSFQTLLEDRNKNYLRLTMLMEICKTLSTIRDMKRVLFIMVDMSLNLTHGSFSSIMLADADGKTQTVSRGLGQDKIETYVMELAHRYPAGSVQTETQAVMAEFQGSDVLECLLTDRGQFIGVLSIGLKERSDFDEYKDLIGTLAIVGSSAMRRIAEEQKAQGPNTAALLHKLLRQWDEAAFETAGEARELAIGFAKYRMLPEADLQDVADACLLAFYDSTLLDDIVRRESLLALLHEMAELRRVKGTVPEADDRSFSENSQIAMLALKRVGEKKPDTQSIDCAPIRGELCESFEEYVRRAEILDLEVSMKEQADSGRDEGRADPNTTIKELTTLSMREQEVLSRVALGSSNREIAEKLFISEHTVKNHMTNIFQKLGVSDRSQLIAMVYQLGYVQSQE